MLVLIEGQAPHMISYAQVATGNKHGNQELLHAWRANKAVLYCTCRETDRVRMNVRNHPKYKEHVQVLYKQDRHIDHDPTCERYAEDSPLEIRRVVKRSAVQEETDENGRYVKIFLRDLFQVEKEQAQQPVPASEEVKSADSYEPKHLIKQQRVGRIDKQERTTVAALIREWYVEGLQIAQERMGQLRSTQAILYGMQMAMLEERIRLDKESLKKIAYIPHPRQYPMEQAIIVGFAQACLSIGEEEEVWQISGVKGAFETVHIEKRYLPNHRLKGNLVAIQTTRKQGTIRAMRSIVDAIIHPNGCVWLDSQHEKDLYEELLLRRLQIEKPLRPHDTWFGYRPDFVLRGWSRPVIVEVWGLMDDVVYASHAAVKRNVYLAAEQAGVIYFLEWDVSAGSYRPMLEHLDEMRKLAGK
ncbi:hypothetical protein MM817_03047 [Acidibacillus sp. S0AB]|uniref:DUF1173 domain-containing protein n=1 Tax=Sulfoacidibacillus ferrooxidans TaxID=2005001 RepID=A0A9X2AEN3_9BACL|nr:hypothetical protein [Sulfoacidibacillus ferrooxidans]